MTRALFFFLALISLTDAAVAAPIAPSDILVIEGDLIRIHRKQPDVRLLGFNAPEVLRAQCRKEKAFGTKSAQRLRELVRGGNLDFAPAACPCAPRPGRDKSLQQWTALREFEGKWTGRRRHPDCAKTCGVV